MITDVNVQALADYIIEGEKLKKQVTTLLAVIEQCRETIEYIGCRVEHPDDSKLPGCPICERVDATLSAIKKVKESK